jgi:hypothetical protein
MANIDDYNQKLSEVESMSAKDVVEPSIPIGICCQEAEDLAQWATSDLARLAAAGLAETKIDDLRVWAGATSQAQSYWKEESKSYEEAERLWKERAPKAYDLRSKLVHAMRYAFRNHPELLAQVDAISEGDGHADMIQDLNDGSVLGLSNIGLLQKVGEKKEDYQLAGQESTELRALLAKANGERNSSNEFLLVRNKMYTKLKEVVDEVRDCGKFVFWREPERVRGYASEYIRRKNAKRGRKSDENEEE